MAKAIVVQLNSQFSTQLAYTLRNLHPNGKHHHVELFLADRRLVHIAQAQVLRLWIFLHRRDSAARILDAIFLARPAVILLVTLAEGTHIHHEHVHFGIGLVLDSHNRLFGGIHATHRRAIIVRLVARADALQKGYLFRRVTVRRTLYVAHSWPGCTQQPLKLKRGDHVGVTPPAVFL